MASRVYTLCFTRVRVWCGVGYSRGVRPRGRRHFVVAVATQQSKKVDASIASWGLPPLIWAAMAPDDDPMPMQLLIQLGHCDPNAKGWFGESVLHVACAYRKYSCVRYATTTIRYATWIWVLLCVCWCGCADVGKGMIACVRVDVCVCAGGTGVDVEMGAGVG